jgi:hypothetical protein
MIYGSYLPLWEAAYGSQPHVTGFRQHWYQIVSGKLVWPSVNGPIPAAWPVLPVNVRGFYTIYPNPDKLLAGELDAQLKALINSAPAWGGVLTAYAEADGGSPAGQFAPLGLTQAKLHQVHAWMQKLCRGTRVRYGSVMCGCSPANAAFAIPGLDFYALDWYDTWSPPLFTALNDWRHAVGQVQPYPVLAIAETNSSSPARRPWWFSSVYAWLQGYSKENGGSKALGFWSYWNSVGQLSGPWLPGDTATIAALNSIAADAASD